MKSRRCFVCAVMVLVVIFIWFVGVDKSWFLETCDDCGFQRDIIQYRLFTMPITENVSEDEEIIGRIARDLGAPCPHRSIQRFHKHRWWGLCFCACPCINGTFGLSGDDSWYDEAVVEKLKGLTVSNPKIGEEFRQRAIYDGEVNFRWRFMRELRDDSIEQIATNGSNISKGKIREVVTRIDSVRWLNPKQDRPQADEEALKILSLGKMAGPTLVEILIDEEPSKWLSWATTGDVAHFFLTIIYQRNWPNEFRDKYALSDQDAWYSYYEKLVKNKSAEERQEIRLELQKAWLEVITVCWSTDFEAAFLA